MKILKTTPLLCVNSIEQSLAFWVDTVGYKKTVEVPHDGKLGFAILHKGESEIMLQTHASLAEDVPAVAQVVPVGAVLLYTEVDSVAEAIGLSRGSQLLVPPRTTFYGSQEIFIRNPDGYVIAYSQAAE